MAPPPLKAIPNFYFFADMVICERNAFDSQTQYSGGDLSLGDFADLLTHQGGADRGFQRDFARIEVHFVGADYLEFHSFIRREIREFDRAQKADPVFGQGVGVNHAGMLQDLLQETDAADSLRLDPPRFPVSGIIAPVPLGTGLREFVLHLRINFVDQVLQLTRNFVVSLF